MNWLRFFDIIVFFWGIMGALVVYWYAMEKTTSDGKPISITTAGKGFVTIIVCIAYLIARI